MCQAGLKKADNQLNTWCWCQAQVWVLSPKVTGLPLPSPGPLPCPLQAGVPVSYFMEGVQVPPLDVAARVLGMFSVGWSHSGKAPLPAHLLEPAWPVGSLWLLAQPAAPERPSAMEGSSLSQSYGHLATNAFHQATPCLLLETTGACCGQNSRRSATAQASAGVSISWAEPGLGCAGSRPTPHGDWQSGVRLQYDRGCVWPRSMVAGPRLPVAVNVSSDPPLLSPSGSEGIRLCLMSPSTGMPGVCSP